MKEGIGMRMKTVYKPTDDDDKDINTKTFLPWTLSPGTSEVGEDTLNQMPDKQFNIVSVKVVVANLS